MKKLRIYICLVITALIFTIMPNSFGIASAEEITEYAYVGGFPIGISIEIGGLLVEDVTGVQTEYGLVMPEGIKKGDIIKSIDGFPVTSVDDIPEYFEGNAELDVIRNGRQLNISVVPFVEQYSQKPRLGIKVKDKLYGVGTVTLVHEDGTYAALGHEIFDSDTGAHIPFCGGNVHDCKILGIKRGSKREAGAILASLVSDSVVGTITCNNNFGIAGKFDCDMRPRAGELLPVADRSQVKLGKAQIRTTVDGSAEYYDIEIIKASSKSGRNEKSLVFRVTDKRLLNKTGGVVRGMSGSPIIQNGMIVGLVTHVLLNDFTKGYGLYADSLNAA